MTRAIAAVCATLLVATTAPCAIGADPEPVLATVAPAAVATPAHAEANLLVLPGTGTLWQLKDLHKVVYEGLVTAGHLDDSHRADPTWPKRLEVRIGHGVTHSAGQIGSIALSGATLGLIPASGGYTTKIEATASNGTAEPVVYAFATEYSKISSMWTLPAKGALSMDVVKDLVRQLAEALERDRPFDDRPSVAPAAAEPTASAQ